jgi:hypothetical protein
MTIITADDADTQRENGFYLIGEERFRSVTAALEVWSKDALKIWSAGLAAEAAFEDMPRLVKALLVRDCGRSYHRNCDDHDWQERCPNCRCHDCMPCVTRYLRDRYLAESARRTDEGSRVHHVVKHWVLTGYWLPVDTDIESYVASFQAFVQEYGLTPEDWELAEARVINRTYGYAGTLDCAFWIHRGRSKASYDLLDRLTPEGAERLQKALILGDYKTREKEDRAIFTDMPLQLGGYRYAEALVLADGRELPMITVDATAIVQIRPDKTSLELVLAEEPEFAAFLNVLGGDQWAQERGKRAVGSRTFSYPPSIVKARAADARRRKKEEGSAAAPPEADPTVKTSQGIGPVNPTPAERGARAAAAAKRSDAGTVWADYRGSQQASGESPAARRKRQSVGHDRPVVSATVAVLGAAGRPGDEEPPF